MINRRNFSASALLLSGVAEAQTRDPLAHHWGVSRDPGYIEGDTWYPGRDFSGVVNNASVRTLQRNRWYRVADTRLDSLNEKVLAVMPTWRDRGNSKWNAVLDNWCSLAWDTRTGREKAYITSSGGHYDGANTGVYDFDARKISFGIQKLPLPDEILDPRWSLSWMYANNWGSFTAYPESTYYYLSNPGNPEGVYSDEIWIPSMGIRHPTPRHTYESQVFVPEAGAQGQVIMGCRRYWRYDVATKSFLPPVFPFGTGVNYSGVTGYTGENMTGFWNSTEQRYYVTPTQNYNQSTSWSCRLDGTDFRWENNYPFGGWAAYYTATDTVNGVAHTVFYNQNGNVAEGIPFRIVKTDLRTRQQVASAVTLGSTFVGKTFPVRTWWDTGSCTYVPLLNGYFVNVNTIQTGECMAFIDSNNVCDILYQDGEPIRTFRLEGKAKFVPSTGLIYLIDRADQNIRVMRV